MKKKLLLTGAILASTMSFAASASTYGPLANFDVINTTGKVAHGFEIEIDGITPSNITSLFGEAKRWPGMERYGFPVVTTTATGVRITYQDMTKSTPDSTASNALTVAPSDSCWPLGAPGKYGPNYPCDHFGVSTNVATPTVRYNWLVETSPGSSSVTQADASVPNPQIFVAPNPLPPIWVQPPAPPAPPVVVGVPAPPPPPLPPMVLQPQPPIVHAVMAAPAPNAYEFGEARWVKATATGSMKNIAVEDLMGDNALIKNSVTQMEWQRLQYDANATGGGANGTIDLSGFKLDQGATSVAYRFEYYAYKGNYDPETHEAIGTFVVPTCDMLNAVCAIVPGSTVDTSGSATPPSTVGKYLGAQMVGANFDGVIPPAPPVPIAPTINAKIVGGIVNQAYSSSFNATPYNAGDMIDIVITGLPAGLSYTSVNGVATIAGTPSVVGSFPISITANDITNSTSITANTTMDIADAPMVFNVTFDAATVGTPYNYPFITTGGYGALTYSSVSPLPAGLSINGNALTGTPTIDGTFPIYMTVKDSLSFSQNAPLSSLVVKKAPAVVVPPAIPAPVACSGTNAIMTSGSPITIEIGGGIANKGQTVDVPASITFVAPLTAANAYAKDNLATFSGFVDDVTKHCAATTASIAQGLSVSTPNPYNGQVGVEYSPSVADLAAGGMAIQISATGGVAPYTVSVSGLPLGMSIDATNTFIGIPTVVGTYTLAISVNDSNGQTINSAATLIVDPAPVPPAACSGTNEVINNISPRAGWLSTLTGVLRVMYPNAANTVIAPGAAFALGNIVSYSGTVDPTGVFCTAATMSISAPVPVCVSPQILNAATNTCVTPVPVCVSPQVLNVAANTCVTPVPVCVSPQVLNAATNTCVTPVPVCVSPQVLNVAANTCVTPVPVCVSPQVLNVATNTCVTPVVAPVSCTAPAGSKSASGQANISAVNAGSVVISGKTVNTLSCTKYSYQGSYSASYPKALVVGYNDQWSGYSVNGIFYATSMIVDNGK